MTAVAVAAPYARQPGELTTFWSPSIAWLQEDDEAESGNGDASVSDDQMRPCWFSMILDIRRHRRSENVRRLIAALDEAEAAKWRRPWDDLGYVRPTLPRSKASHASGRKQLAPTLGAPVSSGRTVNTDPSWLPLLSQLQVTFRQYWPVHWPLFEACLAANVSLLLEKVTQGIGVVLVGDSGAGKNTILEPFQSAATTVWRDKFTTASILSGFAGEGTGKQDVDSRALFRAVQHRVLVVGDLGTILRGGGDKEEMYSVIPPWFDGRGLMFDTGTHGVIGAKGDFSFVMLGGTTPFDMPTWRAMSSVGPRLLFLRVATLKPEERVPARLYDDAKREIQDLTTAFLSKVFENRGRAARKLGHSPLGK
jgi:hypothetical protein